MALPSSRICKTAVPRRMDPSQARKHERETLSSPLLPAKKNKFGHKRNIESFPGLLNSSLLVGI